MSAAIPIAKMSGAGNDFVVIERRPGAPFPDDVADWARRVCRRGLSVGADGVIVVEATGSGRLRVEFTNPDGSAAFCGNGTRCAARYGYLRGLTGTSATLDTAAGEVRASIEGERVRIAFAPPVDDGPWTASLGDDRLEGRVVWAGTPHVVFFVDDVARAPLERWGPSIRRHERFAPAGTNVDLVERRGATLHVRTWEKGVEGETLCCGSGAVAAAMAHRTLGGPERCDVVPRSGSRLEVSLPGPVGRPVEAVLVGDARLVLEGTLHAEATEYDGR
jgi:diaminopimelate epimerase